MSATRLNEDREALRRLRLIPEYAPRNPAHSIEALNALEAKLNKAEEAEARGEMDFAERREEATLAGFDFHGIFAEVRQELRAQFGPNALALHAVGLKRREEYKRPERGKPKATA
ncbi:MAG TPA: hypothetical protein PKD53_11350 [Chloroflexaceae bacterium]|nr:hypothetical protein [Chloroflexaceae bacterium]